MKRARLLDWSHRIKLWLQKAHLRPTTDLIDVAEADIEQKGPQAVDNGKRPAVFMEGADETACGVSSMLRPSTSCLPRLHNELDA